MPGAAAGYQRDFSFFQRGPADELALFAQNDDAGMRSTKPRQAFGQQIVRIIDEFFHFPPPSVLQHARNFLCKFHDDRFQLPVALFIAEVRNRQGDAPGAMMAFEHLQAAMMGIAVSRKELLLLARREMADLENAFDMLRRDRSRIDGIGNLRDE